MLESLRARFAEFLSPAADRFSVLRSVLEELGLQAGSAELAGSRHLILSAAGPARNGQRPEMVLVAHYDRSPGSPGANDNGAAVFQLAEAARRLKDEGTSGWKIVFTDHEERAGSKGVRSQGSYGLALGLKDIGLAGARIFIFDACGRGDTLIVSDTLDRLCARQDGAGTDAARSSVRSLRARSLRTGRELGLRKMLVVPTPFSDDAGFLAAGLCAQTITLLPEAEAEALAAALRSKPALAAALVSREAASSSRTAGTGLPYPDTWSRLNGPRDTQDSLTENAFPLMVKFMHALCSQRD